jgi:hypothetical protein
MMCDNLSLYKTYIPSPTTTQSTTMTPQFYPLDNDNDYDDEHRPYMSIKRKLSDYEDNNNNSLVATHEHVSTSLGCDEEDDDDDDDEDDDEGSSEDEETINDDQSNHTHVTTPCTITQRRHSDTIQTTYSSPIVKRRCTYSSMHDDEQKRSVLVESYRKLRGVKKPKLQVSLLICNLIKRLEKTFTKTPSLPPPPQQPEQHHVQYYQHRTTYRSSSSDSIYMSTSIPSSIVNDEIETTTLTPLNQQYSPPHSSNYDSDKVLLPSGDIRSSHSMYHPTTTDAYWLAQSNFAIPVVSTIDDDDVDVSLQGGGDYLDLSDNTLASSFSSCSSSSSSVSSSTSSSSELISNDCCCSTTSSSSTMTKLLVDTNNNTNDDYYMYHHQHHHSTQDRHSSTNEQTFFYHHNGINTVDIITTA